MTAEPGRPRRTKIVGTLGPASSSPEVIRALVATGLDVARLNFSHGTHDAHRDVFNVVRQAGEQTGRHVALLQDLQGPKIRLGKLDAPAVLQPGERVVLSSRGDFVGSRERLPTTYERLARDVQLREPILLADGAIELEVESIDKTEVVCRVVNGGTVSSNKGINLPGSSLSTPALVDKDRKDVEFGIQLGVDYVALSFVRVPHDVIVLRELMQELGQVIPIIAKIEKPEAVERLEAIIDVSDGIMIARGDLGVELPAERVPTVQRRAIRLARQRGKLTIVATQMLVSMTRHPRPTHAEVSDVANAVFNGTDAVMLSEETASGTHPVKAVEVMSSIVEAAEATDAANMTPDLVAELGNSYPGAISRAAVLTAQEMGAKAIVSFTHKGLGPRLIADWRPSCPILGFAPTANAARRMALFWGVRPFQIEAPSSVEQLIAAFEGLNDQHHLVPKGSTVILTTKMPYTEGQLTNMFKLHTVGGGPGPEPSVEGRESLV